MSRATPATQLAPAHVFAGLWEALADILGTAATATLLRRALVRAAPLPGLDDVTIARDDLTYSYHLPTAWNDAQSDGSHAALRAITTQLRTLLAELTGDVVLDRLARVAARDGWDSSLLARADA